MLIIIFNIYSGVVNMERNNLSRDELIEVLDSILKYKSVFDNRVSRDASRWIPDETNYTIDNSHEYVGYDYTYVRSAHSIWDVICEYNLQDFDYPLNIKIIQDKYGINNLKQISEKKLDFLEIVTILTYIERFNRHADGCVYERYVEDGTYYNLLCRLEEIRSDL